MRDELQLTSTRGEGVGLAEDTAGVKMPGHSWAHRVGQAERRHHWGKVNMGPAVG